MKDYYEIELCGLTRRLPFVPVSDQLAFASFVILGDTELIAACGPELAGRIGPVDALVTAEAKGIALSYELSRELGLKEFIVARKSVRKYMQHAVSVPVSALNPREEQRLYLDGADAEKIRGKHVLVIDDIISTGESLHALEELCRAAGADVVKKAAVLAEGEAANRKDIIFLKKLPLFAKVGEDEYEPIG